MQIDGSGNISNLDFTGSLLVTKIPPKTEVIAVEDSGALYQPPTEHLGQSVRSRDPVVLAEMAFVFYKKNIEELLEKLEKPSSP